MFAIEKGLLIMAANLCHCPLLHVRIRASKHPVMQAYVEYTREFYLDGSKSVEYALACNAIFGCQRVTCYEGCCCGDPVQFAGSGSGCVIL